MRVDVVLCAEQVPAAPGGVAGSHAVVIDVLRATSTIARALASGCAGVLPVAELEQAAARARSLGALLGGERGGLAPSGFDLGNSPRSYDASACAGRLVVLSTTNGSRAI
ncbi:MAG TPA: 2-phosphosulfolactate phosphatase, partial [Planctomycetota bacterium]|nr:2-phosphosulfolactate phosphatase [Planctomycetota bacterium]